MFLSSIKGLKDLQMITNKTNKKLKSNTYDATTVIKQVCLSFFFMNYELYYKYNQKLLRLLQYKIL